MLEVFSLPPFLDELEHSLLLHTLRAYPSGLPADPTLFDEATEAGVTHPLALPEVRTAYLTSAEVEEMDA